MAGSGRGSPAGRPWPSPATASLAQGLTPRFEPSAVARRRSSMRAGAARRRGRAGPGSLLHAAVRALERLGPGHHRGRPGRLREELGDQPLKVIDAVLALGVEAAAIVGA